MAMSKDGSVCCEAYLLQIYTLDLKEKQQLPPTRLALSRSSLSTPGYDPAILLTAWQQAQ